MYARHPPSLEELLLELLDSSRVVFRDPNLQVVVG